MKNFLLKLSVFLLPIVILSFPLDYVVTHGLKKTRYKDFAEWNDIFEGRINADIIISGSSLAWIQISPRILDDKLRCNSYNLGMDGSSFNSQYYRYLAYEKYNRKPKIIIQTLDQGTLKKSAALYNYQQFLPYLDEPSVSDAVFGYQNGISKKDKIIPFEKYIGEYDLAAVGISEFFDIKKFSNEKYKGYRGREAASNYTGIEKALESGKKVTINVDDASIKLFETFLKYCKESGIKLFLIHTPIYTLNQSVIANYREIILIYKNLAEKYDTPILNYSDNPISYRKDLFYDGVHLNKQGSELFSEVLADDLIHKYGLQMCQ